MLIDITSDAGRGASLSRRDLLQIAAVGTAAALPAAAEAATAEIPQLPLTLEQQAEACISELKRILARMHPDFPIVDGDRVLHADGGSTVLVTVHKPPQKGFSGHGFYEIEANGPSWPAGVYHIQRHWSEDDQRFNLWAAYVWDGRPIAPRRIISPAAITWRVKGGVI